MPVLTSPCGQNCTYTLTFDGPQVKCNSYVFNGTADAPISDFNGVIYKLPVWLSDWTPVDRESWGEMQVDCPEGQVGARCTVNTYYENVFFEWNSFDSSNTTITRNSSFVVYPRTVRRLECTPGYGKYTANITFSNGIPLVEVNSTYVGSLVDLWRSSGRMISEGNASRYLDPEGLVKAANLFAVLTSIAQSLKGQITNNWSIRNSSSGALRLYDESIYDDDHGGSVQLGKSIPQNIAIIAELILIQSQLIPTSWTRLSTQNASNSIIRPIGRSECSISPNTTSTRLFKT